jgi:hypothetical protein
VFGVVGIGWLAAVGVEVDLPLAGELAGKSPPLPPLGIVGKGSLTATGAEADPPLAGEPVGELPPLPTLGTVGLAAGGTAGDGEDEGGDKTTADVGGGEGAMGEAATVWPGVTMVPVGCACP